MPRSPLVVRDAVPSDAAALLSLWSGAGYTMDVQAIESGDPEGALAEAAADSDQRIVVGEYNGVVVAAIHMRRAPIGPLTREPVVHTSYLAVLDQHRRHGYAHLLLDAAVSWAEAKGVARMTAFTNSASRDSNRFLARLGLGTVATVRLAPTAALRMRLRPSPRASGSRAISQVLAERRSLRRHHGLTSAGR